MKIHRDHMDDREYLLKPAPTSNDANDTPSKNLQNICTNEPFVILIHHSLKDDKCSRWPYATTNPLGYFVGPFSLGFG